MIEYYLGDPYYLDGRRETPPFATVVPFRAGMTWETASGEASRFIYTSAVVGSRLVYPMSSVASIAMKKGLRFGEIQSGVRLADDNFFRAVIFACDSEEGRIATPEDAGALYKSIAGHCVASGIQSISSPLLFCGEVNSAKVASAARSAFKDVDVECRLFITPELMARLV